MRFFVEELTVSKAIENLQAAQQHAMAGRPKVGGLPYLAETLRRAGVKHNHWFLPACHSLYLTQEGPIVSQSYTIIIRVSGCTKIQPRCARRCVANRPSWEEHLSGVLAGLLARRCCALRCRFHGTHMHVFRV
jgi:uncharacterized protein YbcV (DUF1398 family)